MSGPSGAGKSTILKRLLASYPDKFGFSVSHTTRSPRAGEVPGSHYHYVTRDQFSHLVSQNAFVEHATFGTNNYGTSVASMREIADKGRICILDIEMEGAKQIAAHQLYGRGGQVEERARFMFLAPPSLGVLEERLRGRGTEDEESLRRRLEQAKVEMEWAEKREVVEKVIVNDVLDEAYEEVRKWIFEEEDEEVGKKKS